MVLYIHKSLVFQVVSKDHQQSPYIQDNEIFTASVTNYTTQNNIKWYNARYRLEARWAILYDTNYQIQW